MSTMDEQRLEDYLNLIQLLLSCSSSEEAVATLETHSEFIDAQLLQVMEEVAAQLADKGDQNAAAFLRHIATELIALVNNSSLEESVNFLTRVLQATSDSNANPEVVYPLLQENLDKLDSHFAKILQAFAVATLPEVEVEEIYNIGSSIVNFSTLIAQFPIGDKANNLEIAILGYEIGLAVFTRDRCPEQWTAIQNNLARVYREQNNLGSGDSELKEVNDKLEKIATDIDGLQSALEHMHQHSVSQSDDPYQN